VEKYQIVALSTFGLGERVSRSTDDGPIGVTIYSCGIHSLQLAKRGLSYLILALLVFEINADKKSRHNRHVIAMFKVCDG
jgi:hypothetical protein